MSRCKKAERFGDAGFTIVEIMAATAILMVLVISLSNMLLDSLATTVVSKQREAAAGIANDTLENARALGQAGLYAVSGNSPACPVANNASLSNVSPVPVLTSSSFVAPYRTTVDQTTYTICTIVSATSATSADTISVMVTWSGGAQSYLTSTQVGV